MGYGKPSGMTSTFQIVTSTRAEDAIWEAVREAINSGMTPQQFKQEAAQAWEQHLKDDGEAAKEELKK